MTPADEVYYGLIQSGWDPVYAGAIAAEHGGYGEDIMPAEEDEVTAA